MFLAWTDEAGAAPENVIVTATRLTGEEAGSKLAKAQELQIPIIDEAELFALLKAENT